MVRAGTLSLLRSKEELQISKEENHKQRVTNGSLLLLSESKAAKGVTFVLLTHVGNEVSRICQKSLNLL